MQNNIIKIHSADNVAVALADINKGDTVNAGELTVTALEPVKRGHKIALADIAAGSSIMKYGHPIGCATQNIASGAWVHVHNTKTRLSEEGAYEYNPVITPPAPQNAGIFSGYLREDGRIAVRNEIWVIPTVGCVNGVAEKLCKMNQNLVTGSIDGLYAFPHPFGCSQMGSDHATTRKLLASLAKHPNAGGVLIVSLGCENLTLDQFKQELGSYDDRQIKFLCCQESDDEFSDGGRLLSELAEYAATFSRVPVPVSGLVVGMKCGGSDGLSGITANPTVGVFSDMLIARGASTVLTEVPEMFGAEDMLFNRCINRDVFSKAVKMVNDFKSYFTSHNQVVYENPSPGNKAGGITTLEDKSLGCVQKGGSAPVVDVIEYGGTVKEKGLTMLSGPGNDLVSATALTAAGAHIILFTTGRGTPFGAPAPTIKISTNSALYNKKSGWMDFNAGTVAEGEEIISAAERLYSFVIEVASGKKTKTEENGWREISILKDGVVL